MTYRTTDEAVTAAIGEIEERLAQPRGMGGWNQGFNDGFRQAVNLVQKHLALVATPAPAGEASTIDGNFYCAIYDKIVELFMVPQPEAYGGVTSMCEITNARAGAIAKAICEIAHDHRRSLADDPQAVERAAKAMSAELEKQTRMGCPDPCPHCTRIAVEVLRAAEGKP